MTFVICQAWISKKTISGPERVTRNIPYFAVRLSALAMCPHMAGPTNFSMHALAVKHCAHACYLRDSLEACL